MAWSSHIAYFDESGDHGLTSIDPSFPVFVLCGCLFRVDEYTGRELGTFSDLKFKHFGHDAVVLHSREIRKQIGPFQVLSDKTKRESFMAGISAYFTDSTVVLIAAAIDKARHKATYRNPHNPYDISLRFCLERLYACLKDRGDQTKTTMCVFERRGDAEDALLAKRFSEICSGDNQWGPLPFQMIFASKQTNMPGLQVADLAAYPIARRVIDRKASNPAYDALRPRIRCSSAGEIMGYGLKVFPDSR